MAVPVPARNVEASSYYRVVDPTAADYSITTSDPSGRKRPCRGLIVGATGALVVTGIDGTNVTLPSMSAGHLWPIQAIGLVDSGSACTSVVVLW